MDNLISRQAAIKALWLSLYEYEDKCEKQFLESKELDVAEWFQHRIFVQNMSDIDRKTIFDLPTIDAVPVVHGKWVLVNSSISCSVCGEPNMEWNYCPNCGAKMDGGKDDDA